MKEILDNNINIHEGVVDSVNERLMWVKDARDKKASIQYEGADVHFQVGNQVRIATMDVGNGPRLVKGVNKDTGWTAYGVEHIGDPVKKVGNGNAVFEGVAVILGLNPMLGIAMFIPFLNMLAGLFYLVAFLGVVGVTKTPLRNFGKGLSLATLSLLVWSYVFATMAKTTGNNLWLGVAFEAPTVAAVVAYSFMAKKWLVEKNAAVAKVDGLLYVKVV